MSDYISQIKICMQRDPIICSNLYKLLSTGFRYPAPEFFKTLQNGEFQNELMYDISSIPHIQELQQEEIVIKGMTLNEFETEFSRTFDVGNPVPPCPPYEGTYCEKPRSAVLLEVSEFYNYFGLRMNQDKNKRELPDHISAELEFLHFLTHKEAHVRNEETFKGYLLAQKDFLERHMIEWIPKFCLRLQNSTCLPFYKDLGRITSGFIAYEFELLTLNLPLSP